MRRYEVTEEQWEKGLLPTKKRAFNAIGVSRGGKTSRVHVAVDERGRPCKIILTAGNVNDCDVAYALALN